MGVEYRHYLIPHPNTFRPTAEQLVTLADRLGREGWIAPPGSDAQEKLVAINTKLYGYPRCDWARLWRERRAVGFAPIQYPITVGWAARQLVGESRFEFPIDHADRIGVTYPLVSDAGVPEDAYYEIEIHVSNDYVHHCSECIDSVPTLCVCGEELGYDPDDRGDVFYASRIRARCPKCSRAFDPSSAVVPYRDGFTGNRSTLRGGAAYRFAVMIDCGKCFPRPEQPPLTVHPRLLELCQGVLDTNFYQAGDFY